MSVITGSEYFTPITDAEVPSHHEETCAKYRVLATGWGVSAATAVCYRVRAGFTLCEHAPKFGACHRDFRNLKKKLSFFDEPTRDCLVFWIPLMVPYSTRRRTKSQFNLLGEIRTQLDLPAHHMTTRGSVALNAGLILAHRKATGERVPLNFWIKTDTHSASGTLCLGYFFVDELCYDTNPFSAEFCETVGVFALGVEELEA